MVFLTIRLNAVRSCVLLIRFSSWVLRRSVARYAAANSLHAFPFRYLPPWRVFRRFIVLVEFNLYKCRQKSSDIYNKSKFQLYKKSRRESGVAGVPVCGAKKGAPYILPLKGEVLRRVG